MKKSTSAQPSKPTTDTKPGALLKRPTNNETKRIFVAATRMNDGKTTTCLGLFASLLTKFSRVGFIKPIGQRFLKVHGHDIDEDSFLLDSIYDVSTPIAAMSPIAVDSTFTRRYIQDPKKGLEKIIHDISFAFDRAAWEKDCILIEGTGHAGVGSVFDLSNARVAKLLDAKVIIVAQGGIGRPIDEIALNKALFDQEGLEVVGAILNKVEEDKLEMVKEYAGKGLERHGVPLLGVLPNKKVLSEPNLSQIAKEIKGTWINGQLHGMKQRITRVVIGAMTAKHIIDYLSPGTLIITPGDREDILLWAIASAGLSGSRSIAGIILTRDLKPHPKILDMLSETDIPVINVEKDSYEVASLINKMTVKTEPSDLDKIPVIKEMVMENVDVSRIIEAF
ncbi:MAG: AAA family ATPase [Verrucomicrobia bacterium]|nr:AAA family ATPase [Verrucomicrobiota bacterium]